MKRRQEKEEGSNGMGKEAETDVEGMRRWREVGRQRRVRRKWVGKESRNENATEKNLLHCT